MSHSAAKEVSPSLAATASRSAAHQLHHVHDAHHAPVLLAYRKMQVLVFVHLPQCLQQGQVSGYTVGVGGHHSRHQGLLGRETLGDHTVQQVLWCDDAQELLALSSVHHQHSLAHLCHQARSLGNCRRGQHAAYLTFTNNRAQGGNGAAEHLLHHRLNRHQLRFVLATSLAHRIRHGLGHHIRVSTSAR